MYYDKYIKYKTKYLELKNNFPVNLENIQFGGKNIKDQIVLINQINQI